MKKINRFQVLTFLLILIGFNSFAQNNKRTNFWYFSDSIAIDFNSGAPLESTPCHIVGQGWGATTTMCDTNGNLLFYCSGDSVYNKYHQGMLGSMGPSAFNQGSQSTISLPVPGSDSLFYIFTARMHRIPAPMRYYTIDMSLNNGLGGISSIDTLAEGFDAADQIAAVYLKNKVDYWVITRKHHTDKYAAFLVTSEGVSQDPVLSPAPNTDYQGQDRMGFMKFSYDKKYFATCFYYDVELCKFDVETGIIEYLSKFRLRDIVPTNPFYTTQNCEFSPCSKYMYLGGTLHADSSTHVFQMDMQYIEDSVLFEQSIIKIGEGQGRSLQLGSDGRIYLFFRHSVFGPPVNNYVGVINKPEKHGIACNHQPNVFNLVHGTVGRSFVNFATDFLFRFDYEGICESDTFYFDPWFFPEPVSIEWNFGDPMSGANNVSSIPHAKHKFTDGGEYEVSVRVVYENGRIEETSRVVEVEYAPEPDLGPDTVFCSSSGFVLDADCGPHLYTWSTGAIGTAQITVYDTGWYWVQATNAMGCFEMDSIHLSVYPQSIADTSLLEVIPTTCGGSNGAIKGLEINGTGPFSYQWFDDLGNPVANSLDIYHLSVGNYSLSVRDGNNCSTTFGPYTIHDAGDVLIEEVSFSMEHCEQQDASITISAVSGLNEMLFYSIDNGANYYNNQGLFTGLSAGTYAVRVIDSTDCQCVYINNPVIIENTNAPEITQLLIGNCASGQSNGSIEMAAQGSGDTIFYSIDNGVNFQINDGGFFNLDAGIYSCVVKDEVNCDTSFLVEVPEEVVIHLEAIAGEDEVCPGNSAFVPINVNNFNEVANFKTTLMYDENVMICNGFANAHSLIDDSLQVKLFPAEGKVELYWHDTAVSLPDNTTLTDLVFQSLDPGLSFVSWDGSLGSSLFENGSGLTIPVDYYVGSVKIYNRVWFMLGADNEICEDENIIIEPMLWSSNGGVSYLWTGPLGFSSNNENLIITNAHVNQSGIYSLTITDTLNCYDDESVEIIIHPNPIPDIATEDTIITEIPVQLDAGSSFEMYAWNTGDSSRYVLAEEESWYTVMVQSLAGCMGQDSVFVLFYTAPQPEPITEHMYMPTAFTPDVDGINDVFKPVNPSSQVSKFNMQIFNRWGALIFETTDYTYGWDGKLNGQILPTGAYAYKISYSIKDKSFIKTGIVNLLKTDH